MLFSPVDDADTDECCSHLLQMLMNAFVMLFSPVVDADADECCLFFSSVLFKCLLCNALLV